MSHVEVVEEVVVRLEDAGEHEGVDAEDAEAQKADPTLSLSPTDIQGYISRMQRITYWSPRISYLASLFMVKKEFRYLVM